VGSIPSSGTRENKSLTNPSGRVKDLFL